MKIYAISDIHGDIDAFDYALSLIDLSQPDVKLILLGDYIHGGRDSYGVLDKIMQLEETYGKDKVVALQGNHEEFAVYGTWPISEEGRDDERDGVYLDWMGNLPLYHVEGNTIFVHAGIDEEAGDAWEFSTAEETFLGKFPAETGEIEGISEKVVAGHVYTSEISGDDRFFGIYYDGASHYYIDGMVHVSGEIPVLMVDTELDKYYRITENGIWEIEPYEE